MKADRLVPVREAPGRWVVPFEFEYEDGWSYDAMMFTRASSAWRWARAWRGCSIIPPHPGRLLSRSVGASTRRMRSGHPKAQAQ
jgi:hypothetical protein